MAFSGDGAKLATADHQGTIKIWADPQKLTSNSAALWTLKGHRGGIRTVSFSTDGKRLVTTSVDKTVRVWDLENPDPAIRPLDRFGGTRNMVARFSPDGQLVAAPRSDATTDMVGGNRVLLWDAATGRPVRDLRAADNAYADIYSVAFSPTDSRLLAAGCGRNDGSFVSLWDIDTGTELARLPGATNLPGGLRTGAVGALAFSPDGKYLVAGFGERNIWSTAISPNPVKVWEVATRRPIHLLNGHSGYCTSLAFSKDGTLLASGSRDGTAIIWSIETWKALQTLQNPDPGNRYSQSGRGQVEDVAFSPDGKTLALASNGGTVQLWDVSTGKLLETLKGHSSGVAAVVFSPDGRTLASGGGDQTVRLWNVETRRELMQLDPGSFRLGTVKSLDFSPDGKQLLAAGSNAVLWSAAPIVWNDSYRAAEKLRLLLQSSMDFQIRIRMLSENPRWQGTLEKLEQLAPNDARVQTALAVARARRLAEQANVPLAHAASAKARLLLERRLTQEPENSAWAVELAEMLLIDSHQSSRLAMRRLSDPWAKLAAAYHVIGDQQSFDQLLEHHPDAASCVGDLYAASQDWERAIAEYGKLLTDRPADVALLTKLATAYQTAGRTREAVPYLARASAANPKDTLLALDVAARQAWFGQEKELAATRQRIRAFAKGTNDAVTAERAAKVCSIRASTDRAELEAAVGFGRTAVKLDEHGVWNLLALGMAEYRSGNDATAVKALLAAAKADPNNRHSTGIASFYRAMSQFRQGKGDEARKVAIAAAAQMKPLPKDEQNPLANGAYWDDLILWLAYKETKAMIRFDAAPPPKAENDKK
jgi:WD40 repeat protein/tetratricopeptide (TPR) repeat protein